MYDMHLCIYVSVYVYMHTLPETKMATEHWGMEDEFFF